MRNLTDVYEKAYQFGRWFLPGSTKRWIKRVLLRVPMSPPLSSPGWKISSQTRLPRTSTYDVICFAMIDWDYRYQRPQHLCSLFAQKGHRVFYISVTFSGIPGSSGQPHQDMNLFLREMKERVYDVQLPGPAHHNPYGQCMEGPWVELLFRALDQLRTEQRIQEAVCFVGLPFWKPLVLRLKSALSWKLIYDCFDLHQGFTNFGREMLAEEEELARKSDLVVASSKKLQEARQRQNARCILIPNAADFAHFRVNSGLPPPPMTRLKKPVLGYYGALEDWFDSDLVEHVARSKPDWNFVLIGLIGNRHVARLRRLPNVYLLGEKPYKDLPAYLHQFDVCLVPFQLTPLTEAANPVKFYEYLSAGKPVVATPLPELLLWEAEGYVYIAHTPEKFLEQIERALREDSAERRNPRITFACKNTWEERFTTLKQVIDGLRAPKP